MRQGEEQKPLLISIEFDHHLPLGYHIKIKRSAGLGEPHSKSYSIVRTSFGDGGDVRGR